jgi:hypothetical protein
MNQEKKNQLKQALKTLGLVVLGLLIGVSWLYAVYQYHNISQGFEANNVPVVSAAGIGDVTPTIEGSGRETSPSAETEIADKIYTLESSGGKNDWCQKNGQGFNGYGFAQNKGTWMCYDTQDEVEQLVLNWINDRKREGMSEAELVCYYNTGIKQSNCPYYQKYLSI